MDRSKRRSNARARGRERSRQMVYLAAIGSVLGVGLFAAGELKVGQFLPWLPRLSLSKPAPVPTEEEIYTASILYLPNEGTTCRQLLFDNRTGRFRDNGLVGLLPRHQRKRHAVAERPHRRDQSRIPGPLRR
jgi:hypothetical protein